MDGWVGGWVDEWMGDERKMALRYFSDLAVLTLVSQKSNKIPLRTLEECQTPQKVSDTGHQNGVKHRSHGKAQTWLVQSNRYI